MLLLLFRSCMLLSISVAVLLAMDYNANSLYHDILNDNYESAPLQRRKSSVHGRKRSIKNKKVATPPAELEVYNRRPLPPIPTTSFAPRSATDMTFEVLTKSPNRLTLTNPDALRRDSSLAKQGRKVVHLTPETTPLQSPQPRQHRSKIEQLTGYNLGGTTSPSGSVEPKRESISPLSSAGSGSVYSEHKTELKNSPNNGNEWGNWTPVDYAASKQGAADVFYQQPRKKSLSTSQLTSNVYPEALSLRTKDRPETPSNGGLATGQPEPYHRKSPKTTDDLPIQTRTWRQFSFDNSYEADVSEPRKPSQYQAETIKEKIFLPYSPDDLTQDNQNDFFNQVDKASYALPPLLPVETATSIHSYDRQDVDNVSRFSDSDDEGDSRMSNTRDSIISGVSKMTSPFRQLPHHPSSLFREKHKPSSIRTSSPTPTTSTHRSNFSNAKHPLKSPFPFNSLGRSSTEEEGDEYYQSPKSTFVDNSPTGRFRLSDAFRKTSKQVSPTAQPIIKSRIIQTDARKPGGPDTPFPTKLLARRNSAGGKFKTIGDDVKDMLKGSKAIANVVGRGVMEMAGSKTTYEEKREKRRKEALMKSIRVVRIEDDGRGNGDTVGSVKVTTLQEARERMDLWV